MSKDASEAMTSRVAQISIEQFTEAAFSSVLRAIDARNRQVEDPQKIFGPIIYGIWFNLPEVSGPKGPGIPGAGPVAG